MSRRVAQSEASVTLFPFLAVLICTMGVLILLLVVVVQQARHQAVGPPTAKTEPVCDEPTTGAELQVELPQNRAPTREVQESNESFPPADDPPQPSEADIAKLGELDLTIAAMQEKLSDIRWQNEQLAISRDNTKARLDDKRLDLSRIEDQNRRLAEELEIMEAEAQSLLDAEAGGQEPNLAINEELARLQIEIEQTEDQIEKAKELAEKRRRQYAIIPYEGPNGTKRRPIYIECTPEHVILQPEGIVFDAADFREDGPGNPLAVALRATREYLSNAGMIDGYGEPYPLLLVRPGGDGAYQRSRKVLRGWEDGFGYELLPPGIELAFPPADKQLNQFLATAVDRARSVAGISTAVATHSMDGHPGQGGGQGSNATGDGEFDSLIEPRGSGNADAGLARSVNPAGGSAQNRLSGLVPAHPNPAVGNNRNFGSGGPAGPGGTSPTQGDTNLGGQRYNGSNLANTTDGKFGGTGHGTNSVGGSELDLDDLLPLPAGVSLVSPPKNLGVHELGNQAGLVGSMGAEGTSNGGFEPSGSGGGGTNGNGATAGSGGEASGGMEQGSGSAGGQSPAFGGMSSSSGFHGQANGASSSQTTGAAGSPGQQQLGQQRRATSIASTQGENWALPNAANGAIGISRPIRVACGKGGIALIPEIGSRQKTRAVPFEKSVREAIQPFVAQIWKEIERWGIAGPGVYWKPVLQVTVEPGAESQFEEMTALLEGSGLEIRRR